ncbi:predicted protein [Naegleria gruberi]|uniref:Predicted protein n=1 Tax=Naegleria gruberi TaxID=5762 RepID=D2VSP6_NAEGR|nr:uncharacterized protein NAEGRDRAFT_72015 [Naegleria gruberi]EFC40227.1 predicted protein [Naegleria gruberi]|eukprot:XP_002672971.1 predicted protein [Naegleria gruberi strain NEG-M]
MLIIQDDLPSPFSDLMIISYDDDDDENINSNNNGKESFVMLQKKLARHVCNEGCFAHLPVINYRHLFVDSHHECLEVGPSHNLLDEKCEKSYSKLAIEILDEFIRESDSFVGIVNKIHFLEPNSLYFSENNIDRLDQFTIEYRKCGKICLYHKVDLDFDIIILLINKFEFLYLGNADSQAFYGMPGLTYSSSHNCDEMSSLFPKKIANDSFDPIPLDKLLLEAKNYFQFVLY